MMDAAPELKSAKPHNISADDPEQTHAWEYETWVWSVSNVGGGSLGQLTAADMAHRLLEGLYRPLVLLPIRIPDRDISVEEECVSWWVLTP